MNKKFIVFGFETWVFASSMLLGSEFYIGGQIGLGALTSTYSKNLSKDLPVPNPKKTPLSFKRQIEKFKKRSLELKRQMAFVPVSENLSPLEANVTLWQGESAPYGFGIFPQNLDSLAQSDLNDPQDLTLCADMSLRRAEKELRGFLNGYITLFKSTFDEFGFEISQYYGVHDTFIDSTGEHQEWIVKQRVITNSHLPGFKVDLITPFGHKQGGFQNTLLKKEKTYRFSLTSGDFLNIESIKNACYDIAVRYTPDEIEKAFMAEYTSNLAAYKAAIQTLENTQTSKGLHHLSLALVVGWDRACPRVQHRPLSCYLGAEAFARLDCGKVILEGPLPRNFVQSKLRLTTRQVLGCSVLPGFSLPERGVVHAVLTGKLTRHRFEVIRDLKGASAGCSFGDALQAFTPENWTSESQETWSDTLVQWNPGFEAGLGIRMPLNPNLTFGLRWTQSLGNKMEFKTPAYASNSFTDLDRFGAIHTVRLNDQRVALELLCRF